MNPTWPPAALSSMRMAGASSSRRGITPGVHERIVERMDDQRRTCHTPQVLPATRRVVVVFGVAEAVQGRRDSIVESAKGPLPAHRVDVEWPRSMPELLENGTLEIDDEVALVDP